VEFAGSWLRADPPAVNHSSTVPQYGPGMNESQDLAVRVSATPGDALRPLRSAVFGRLPSL
jgi:hypothetical protein